MAGSLSLLASQTGPRLPRPRHPARAVGTSGTGSLARLRRGVSPVRCRWAACRRACPCTTAWPRR
eukprot:1875883-Lingulodinium_polyedra.AAC.1